MLKKLNVFILMLLFLSQTVLGPMTAVAGTVEPVADEKVVEQSVSEQEDDAVEEPAASDETQEDEQETESTTSADKEKSKSEEVEQESTDKLDGEEDSNPESEKSSTTTDEDKSSEDEEEVTEEESEEVEEESAEEEEVDEAVQAAYEAAKKAVEKALKSEKKVDIEKALELIEAVKDEELQAELVAMLGDLQIRPAAEQDHEFFDFAISKITDLDKNPYAEGNPLKPDDEFWVVADWELKNGHSYQAGDTTRFQLPKELHLGGNYDGNLTDELGNLVATYVITQDGEVTLTFTDFVESNSEVTGWLDIRAQLDQNVVEEKDGNVVIGPIDDEGSQVLPLDRSPIDKTVEKQGQPNKSYNADEIEWTVTINKNANSLKEVTLEDLLPAGTEYVEGSLKAVKQAATLNGKPVGDASEVSVTPSVTDGTLSIPLGDIEEVYTLTYTTKVTDTEVKNFKNKVTFKDADLEDTNAEATVTIDRGEPLNKGAVKDYDPKTGIIEWYLDINYDQKDLTDVTLTDSWADSEAAGKMALVDGTVKFQEMTIDENGKATGVGEPVDPSALGATLVKEEDGFKVTGITTDKAYRVLYQTKATDRQLDGFRIENTASFNGTEKGAGYNVGQYVGVKTAGKVDYDAKTIEWEIKLNMDEVSMNNVVITDTVGEGLTLIPDSLTVTHGGAEHDFTLSDKDKNPFKVDLGNLSKEVVVKYKTTFDADHVPNQKPTNKADVVWTNEDGKEFNKELETNTQLNQETVNSSWKNATYNPDTKEITWTIIANYRENAFEDFNITDTPKGNQQLIEDSIQVIEMKVNAGGAHVDQGPAENADIAIDGNAFNVHLGETDKAYKVVYKTSVAGLEDLAKEYANEAQIKDGDEVVADLDAKVSVYGDRKYGSKYGEQDGRRVNWSIDVNLAQEKISNLALEDTISDNQAYIEDSIKVYHAKLNADGTVSKADEVSTSEYDLVVNETDFEVVWKNDVEHAFVVEYSTLFFAKDGEDVRNDYKITGDGISEEDSDASDGYNVTVKQTTGGGAEGTVGYLLVHKTDTTYGQAQQPISGIQFELIDTSNDKVLKTVTTDEDGYADFGRLLFGEYKLREVNTPDGYVGFEEQVISIDKPFEVGESDPLDYKLTIENYKANNEVELVKYDDKGNRLAGAEFTLFTTDGTKVDTQTTNAKGEIVFKDLAVGNYYVQETKAPNGFELDDTKHEVEITETQRGAIQLEVENKRKVTSVTLEKEWVDPEGQELRPDEVTVNLFRNGDLLETYTIKASDDWKLIIDDLDAEDENGEPYEYSMTEQEVEGYAPSFDDSGLKVINTRAEERDFTITKTWNDNQNDDGKRPNEVEVELLRSVESGDAELVETYTLTADNNWEVTTEELPMFDENGKTYHYEVKEHAVEGYESQVDGFDVTNTRVGETRVSGEKTWKDDGDVENRPDSITVYLHQNDEVIEELEVTADEDGRWHYAFENLEKYDKDGKEYRYIVTEEPVFGYTPSIWATTPGIFNIDNIRVGTTSLTGQKTWVDGDNNEETRPTAIEVQLLQNGEPYGELTEVTADHNWTYEIENLPMYDSEGVAYEYTVEEAKVEGYETIYDGNDIINTLVGETEVTVEKVWKGEATEEVSVQLLANEEVIESAKITAEDDWVHTFTDLPKYDSDGVEIDYTVEEVDIAGYVSEITGDADKGFIVTNTRAGETDVSVTKTWLGAEGESATIHLLANGEKVEGQSVELTADADWRHTFEALEEFDANGEPIEYTIEEEAMEGFTPQYDGNAEDGFFITNVRSGETSVEVTKAWKDEDETDRPETIQVNLLANDVVVSEHDVTAENDWTLTIDELPKYDENGEEIAYSISEQDVPGYESTVDGFDIANTRVDKKSITINKAWLDEDAENRPTSIEVELFRSVEGGEPKSVETYTVSAENDWTLTIEDLPAFDTDGKAYTYEIEEAKVEGYESTVNGFEITNLREGKTAVDVTKVWKGEAAESATVYLLANGEKVEDQEVDLTEDNDWKHTFADLDQFDQQGKTITYTVKEVDMEGYASEVTGNADDGFTVTNVREGTTAIAGTKTWVDDGAEDERPKSITIKVLQNGEEYDTVTVTPKSNWTYNVPNLPKYDENGKAYEYTVVEDDVEGYESTVDGFDITNVRVGTTAVDVTKVWKDEDETDRPETIQVNLLANDVVVSEHDVTAENNWTLTIDDLPKYDENGKEIAYTISEQDVPGYESTVDGFDITNTRVDQKSITINKAWLDEDAENRPASIEVELFRSVEGGKQESVETYTVSAENDWTLTIEDLPSFDADGKAYTYEIEEADVDGYASTVNGFDITNVREGKTAVDVTKVWKGEAAESATVYLLANGEKVEGQKVDLTEDNDWKHTFADLDQFDEEGKAITYTVEEVDMKGYASEVTGNADDGFTVTNTLKTYAIGDYVWVDRNKDGIQGDNEEPLEGVIVELFDEDGNKIAETKTDGNGRYLFDELPAGNYKVKFTLTEEQAKKYKFTKQHAGDDPTADSNADENGWTTDITLNDDNEYLTKDYTDQDVKATEGIDPTWDAGVIELVEIEIRKTWVDEDESARPDAITVQLFANDDLVKEYEVTAGEDWQLVISGLTKYDDQGEAFTYTISETEVEGYEASIDGFDITNTWIDEENPVIPGEEDEDEEKETEDPKDEPSDQEGGKDEGTADKGDDKSDGDQGQEDGNTLPKTATNTFTIGLVGIVLLLIGLVTFVTRRRLN